MMASRAARRLAEAIRSGARHHESRVGRRAYRGTITSLEPLGVDLHGVDFNLDDQDIALSQDVQRYQASEGLRVGDELALLEVDEGDWIAVTVVSDTTVRSVPSP